MPSAFVSKLAAQGARDPEALAAWIGRKKHGKAFAKLAAAGRKKADDKSASKSPEKSPEVRNARAQVAAASKRAAAARDRADRANESVSGAYGRFAGGQPILSGHHSERSALRDRARADAQTRRAIAATEAANKAEADVRKAQADAQGAEMRADRSRSWAKDDFQPGDTVQLDRAGRPGESYQVVRANAKSVTVSRGFAGMDNKNIPYDKILSRTRDGKASSDPEAAAPTATAPTSPDEPRRAAGMAALAAHQQREAERAQKALAEQRQKNAEGLARINAAPGKPTRKAMTPEERGLVNYEANKAAMQDDAFEQLRPFADESAQTDRIGVLKSRAFNKARADRIKNGWKVPGEESAPPAAAPAAPRRRDPVAEARARNAEAEQQRQREEASQRARLERQAEAADRAVGEQVTRALTQIRGLTSGARGQGSFHPDEREAISGQRLRRMSDEDIKRNLSIIRAVAAAEEISPVRLSREDRTMLFNVGHDLRRELDRRRSRR